MDHFNVRDGELHCENVALGEIAHEAETRIYVYSTGTIRHHCAATALPKGLAKQERR